MARYVTTVRTSWAPEVAFGYMADLRNFSWSGTPGCGGSSRSTATDPARTRRSTPRSPGSAANLVLRYRTVEFTPATEVLVVARTSWLTSEDRITVVPEEDGGSSVTYDVDLRLSGVLRPADLWTPSGVRPHRRSRAGGLRRVLA